jgi:hypothetical protein
MKYIFSEREEFKNFREFFLYSLLKSKTLLALRCLFFILILVGVTILIRELKNKGLSIDKFELRELDFLVLGTIICFILVVIPVLAGFGSFLKWHTSIVFDEDFISLKREIPGFPTLDKRKSISYKKIREIYFSEDAEHYLTYSTGKLLNFFDRFSIPFKAESLKDQKELLQFIKYKSGSSLEGKVFKVDKRLHVSQFKD